MSHHGRAPLPEASVLQHTLVAHSEQLHLDLKLDCKNFVNMLDNLHLDILCIFKLLIVVYVVFVFVLVLIWAKINEILDLGAIFNLVNVATR